MTATLAHCSVCQGTVASNATGCPHCGARFSTPMSTAGKVITGAGLIGQLALWGCLAAIALFILIAAVIN